jgi:D-glycero-D-manno-heptose 1,7-bisphosphate phosphatase
MRRNSRGGLLPAVFIDRDGVLNQVVADPDSGLGESPLSLSDVAIVEGAGRQIARLRDADWFVVCVTNQPSAAKGTLAMRSVLEIHERIRSLLAEEGGAFDGERICFHHPEGIVAELTGVCRCRKPEPGMLIDAATEYGLDLGQSWMLGDTDADVLAGLAAGVRQVLVKTKGTEHKRSNTVKADIEVLNLTDAITAILANPYGKGP